MISEAKQFYRYGEDIYNAKLDEDEINSSN